MPFSKGKFVKPGSNAVGPNIHPKPGTHPVEKNGKPDSKPQAPHNTAGEKHVQETHAGKTEGHPVTGVHAFHAHHTGSHSGGGSSYTTHTHHDDGIVDSKENQSHDEMTASQNEAFPPQEQADNQPMDDDGSGMGDDMGESVGGMAV